MTALTLKWKGRDWCIAVRTDIVKRTVFKDDCDGAIKKAIEFMDEYPDFNYIQISRDGSIKGKMLIMNPLTEKEKRIALINKHVKIYFFESDDIYR
jgi:hypothetical protein